MERVKHSVNIHIMIRKSPTIVVTFSASSKLKSQKIYSLNYLYIYLFHLFADTSFVPSHSFGVIIFTFLINLSLTNNSAINISLATNQKNVHLTTLNDLETLYQGWHSEQSFPIPIDAARSQFPRQSQKTSIKFSLRLQFVLGQAAKSFEKSLTHQCGDSNF